MGMDTITPMDMTMGTVPPRATTTIPTPTPTIRWGLRA
jgi:hypothetical protein